MLAREKSSQVTNGKAYEYAIARALSDELQVEINPGPEYSYTKYCFDIVSPHLREIFPTSAKLAIKHILEKEKGILSTLEPISIAIAGDSNGQKGDVRDVIVLGHKSELGISCKSNHDAFKHSRLSDKADFVKRWNLDAGGCSEEYWAKVNPIFGELRTIKLRSGGLARWSELENVPERFYWSILDAFESELLRLSEKDNPASANFSKNLISYIIGNRDFYKVIARSTQVTIQGFNFNGTLSIPRTKFPDQLVGIDRLDGSHFSKTVRFNRGFTFNFRIHSASSRVEPSLKFDITAVSLPQSEIYTHHMDLAN